jgi:hypothetical protein
MMQGIEVAIVSVVVACISVVVAAALAVLQLRNQNRTRQAQLFMELYNQFYTPEFHRRWMEVVFVLKVEDLSDADGMPKYLKGDIEPFVDINALCCFFEGMGLLVSRKLIDISLVAELMSTPIIFVWDKVHTAVEQTREVLGRPQAFEWFEYLQREMKRIPSRQSQRAGQPVSSS